MQNFAVLSLIFLIATIVIAFSTNKNTGLIALAFALVLGRMADISDKSIIAGFNTSLFIMLLGLSYLFAIAQNNGTLELLAKKIIQKCGTKVKLLPFVVFLLAAALSAVGPGPISVSGLMGALCISLSLELGISPIILAPFGALGAFAGGLSPFTPSGIIAITQSEGSGIMGITVPLFISIFLEMALYAIILYFPVFKWHKLKISETSVSSENQSFNKTQIITLAGIFVTIILTLVFNVHVGLSALTMAVIISMLGKSEESVDIASIPIATLIMVCGVGVLIELVRQLGGVDLLSDFLSSHLNTSIATPIMTIIGGVLSWVSSASGVVMPTLIPTAPGIALALPGASMHEIAIGICVGAHAAAVSPLSSCGAMILASYTSMANPDSTGRNKMFVQLFAISAGGVLFSALLAVIGCYGWFI